MSGRYVRLRPGRYTLHVSGGEGPAGIRRNDGRHLRVEVNGGRADFRVARDEEVFYWWRGPRERPGVRLLGVSGKNRSGGLSTGGEQWPTGTTG